MDRFINYLCDTIGTFVYPFNKQSDIQLSDAKGFTCPKSVQSPFF